MKGEIWLDSKENVGSNFYFTMPFEAEANEIVEITNRAKRSARLQNILIAEDNEVSRQYLSELLNSMGIKTLWAKTGPEAIKMYKENNIDLVLMDIKMPEMEGTEAAKIIKEFDSNAKIIAQTAYAFQHDKNRILSGHFDAYITKPILFEDLYSTINSIHNG